MRDLKELPMMLVLRVDRGDSYVTCLFRMTS